MSSVAYAQPVIYADEDSRISYLRKVATLTFVGLAVSFGVATASAFAFALVPLPRFAVMAVVFGSFMGAQYGGQAMINRGLRYPGFFVGSALQGVAMGYLLLMAVMVSGTALGNPFLLIGEALVLVSLTAMGMIGYLLSGPKNLSLIRAGMATFALPMFALMIMSVFWSPGGFFGVLMSIGFVAFSGAGLLYELNTVMHKMRTDMEVEGAFMITMGLLVLFWNVLVLLMKLQGRD